MENLSSYALDRLPEGGWRVAETKAGGARIPIADFVSYRDALDWANWRQGVPRLNTYAATSLVDTKFLNIDFDLCVKQGLNELLRAMGDAIVVLHQTTDKASFELGDDRLSLEDMFRRAVALVTALPARMREIWDNGERRVANIGIQAGDVPHAATFSISNSAVQELGRIGVDVVITVYAKPS